MHDALTPRIGLPRNTVAHANTATPKSSFYIPSLDGIRALSFLLVFVSHAGLGAIIPGGFGVTIFFFLSGYLITTLLRMEYDQSDTINFKHFYLRRTLRIFPTYYAVLGIATLLAAIGAIQGELQPGAVLSQLFYLSNYRVVLAGFDGMPPGTGIYWSLAVEEHFYLVFPLLYLVLRRTFKQPLHQWLALGALCLLVLAWRCVLVYGYGSPEDRTYVATDARIDSILFGCMLAVYGNPVLDKLQGSARWWLGCWVPIAVLALLVSLVVRDGQFRETFRYTIQGIALTPLFIAAIRYHDWPVIQLLNLGWVRFLGVLSYALYLVHQVVIVALEQWMGSHPLLRGIAALILSIGAAIGLYYLIERPFTRLRKRLQRAEA